MKKKTLFAVITAGIIATTAQAQISEPGDGSSDSDISIGFPIYDMHGNNRAIAFGSVLLAAEHGVDNWQALQAWDLCSWIKPWPGDEVPPTPIPEPGEGSGETGESGDDDQVGEPCSPKWDVMVTTDYALHVCPDGRAYIMRSGIGTFLEDRHTGQSYAWSELIACGDDLKAAAYNEKEATQKSRPLDRNAVVRTFY